MGNNPVSHIDPDGGYETWLGAFIGWVGGGFSGTIEHTGGAGNHNYGIFHEGQIFNDADLSNGILGSVRPDYYSYGKKELGTPVFKIQSLGGGGITLPTFDGGAIIFSGSYDSKIVKHERGHVEQIREYGAFGYLKDIGIPSVYNTLENRLEKYLYGKTLFSIPHEEFYTETDANNRAFWLYGGNFYSVERRGRIEPYNPLIGKVSELTTYQRLKAYTSYKEYHQYMKFRKQINASNTFNK